jgi:C4-dicarboxylate-specific signal transduction histidine kinase
MKRQTQGLPNISVATFVATDGSVLNYTRSFPPPQIDLSDRDYFAGQIVANEAPLSLGKAVENKGSGEWTFYLAKAIYGHSNRKLGIALTGAGVRYFANQFTHMLDNHESSGRRQDNAYLVRDDGVLLAATFAGYSWLGKQIISEQRRGSDFRDLGSLGKMADLPLPFGSVISASRLPNFPAFVVTVTDTAPSMLDWWQTVWVVIGGGLALCLIVGGVEWRNYRYQRERERILRQQSEHRVLSAIFTSPLVLAALVTRDLQIIYCNSSFSDRLKDFMHDQKLVLGPQVEGGEALASYANGQLSNSNFRLCLPGKNCSLVHLSFSATSVDLGQGEYAIALLGHDDSQRMQSEAHIIQSAKLITLGEMATGMAHELNQPLNVIKMAAQSALFEVEESRALDPDASAEPVAPLPFVDFLEARLRRVIEQVDRAATMIDHMRIFGRVPSGLTPVIDVASTCRAALQLIGHQLREAQIEVALCSEDALYQVKFHPVLLEQVIINLLINSRDALTAVPVARRNIRIVIESTPHHVTIVLSDNGPGIPPEIRSRIFEPFFTTKSTAKGTGLGLSVSYGIVRDSGGQLELANNDLPGCTFRIILPIATVPSVSTT